jgi:hypothetical protein
MIRQRERLIKFLGNHERASNISIRRVKRLSIVNATMTSPTVGNGVNADDAIRIEQYRSGKGKFYSFTIGRKPS